MSPTVIFFLVVCGGIPVLAILAFIFATPFLSRSRLTTRVFENKAYHQIRCPSCTYGVQYLHPDKGAIPIPRHLRMVIKGRDYIGSPQANVMGCRDCGGSGWTSTKIKGAVDVGYEELT